MNKLIYDIGLHNGNDTAYYLKEGFNVVAIEANPILVQKAKKRFKKEIKEKKLVLLNIGISNRIGKETFWINEENNEWSSFIKEFGCRNGTKCKQVKIECMPFKDIYKKYGKAYYIKCDIEGYDKYCLLDLSKTNSPPYISVEAHSLEYLCILHNLGYKNYKVIDQSNHSNPTIYNNETMLDLNNFLLRFNNLLLRNKKAYKILSKFKKINTRTKVTNWQFPVGSSGPFAENTFGNWQSLEEVAYNWLHFKFGNEKRGTLNMKGWYDFHAKK